MANAPDEHEEPGGEREHDEDFRFALERLLDVYRPVLEEELRRATSADALRKEAEERRPYCDDELKLADRIFSAFHVEEVAVRLLAADARALLGPLDRWRWCLRHIRCCMVFGWLICRGPRTFRAFVYYLYRYWRCVREALGTPLQNPLTADQRHDFDVLVQALAGAYRPYLTDQLAGVDFPDGLPDEVADGKIDCFEGQDESAAIFERLLSPEAAQALLGKDAFAAHVHQPWFWFCRCWCLCAIRFGCCLAQARSLIDVYYCLLFYHRCLRDCFGRPRCELTQPQGCVAEDVNVALGAFVVPVIGTAAGGGFSHYVLEWSDGGPFNASDFHYPPVPPGGGVQGNVPVVSGLLAYFDTSTKDPGTYSIRLTVHTVTGAQQTCGPITFDLFKKDVRILGVHSYFTMDTGWADPAARFVENIPAEPNCGRPAATFEVSFGGCLSIQGGAFVGGCHDRKIKRYMIDSKPGFEANCFTGGWTNRWIVEYNTPEQYLFINWRTDNSTLTSVWGPDCIPHPFGPACGPPPFRIVNDALLYPSCWESKLSPACDLSGLFTLRLMVEDTLGGTYCDTQRLWIDNKPITALIKIDAVPQCEDVLVSQFALPPDCGIPWPLPLSGIAFDEYIDPLAPLARPNDNFDHYIVRVRKQGGPALTMPVPGPTGTCFKGLSRVGDPGVRCGLPGPFPPPMYGTLAQFDLRAVDLGCNVFVPWDPAGTLKIARGECCVYIFELFVYDRTKRNFSYFGYDLWPVKICNDLR